MLLQQRAATAGWEWSCPLVHPSTHRAGARCLLGLELLPVEERGGVGLRV
jgi:hypothetical protein